MTDQPTVELEPLTTAPAQLAKDLEPRTSNEGGPPQGPAGMRSALGSRAIGDVYQNADRSPEPRCAAVRADGSPCGQRRVLRVADGRLLCRWHRTGSAAKRRRPKPPVDAIVTLEDCLVLTSWASIMVARGEMEPKEAGVIATLSREYRMSLADASSLKRVKELERAIAILGKGSASAQP